jgi:hypothetical protein
VGFEPTCSFEHGHLKPARKPISPRPQSGDRTPSHFVPNLSVALPIVGLLPGGRRLMRSAEEFNDVKRFIAAGMNDGTIARQTGIPRPTVRDWRRRPPKTLRRPGASSPCGVLHDFSTLPAAAYSYLLGLYLGDGCISQNRRVWRLRIVLDTKYPQIIERCRAAIDMLMPGQHASATQKPTRCVEVGHYSKHWPCLFPQHGPAENTTDASHWSLGSRHSSTKRQKSSSSA